MATKTIGIDIREAGEGKAGKARYVLEITKALIKLAPKDTNFVLFTKKPNPVFASSARAHQILIRGRSIFWHLGLRDYLRHHPVDFFIAPSSFIYPALALPSQKLAIVVHDLIAFLYGEDHAWLPTLIERFTLRRAIKKADLLVCVSQNTAKDLANLFPEVHKKPVLIAPPAVSLDVKWVSSQKMDIPPRYILGVGTLSPRKNFELIFRAFPCLAKKHPDLHLVIAGGKGWKTARIYRSVPKDFRHRIHFLGHVSLMELNELYSRAAMLVFPSVYEGFGIPPLEAMACGCPVIASVSSSLPEVVGDAALQIDPYSEKALIDSVTLMLKPHIHEIYKRRGFKQAKRFSWEDSAEKILARVRMDF